MIYSGLIVLLLFSLEMHRCIGLEDCYCAPMDGNELSSARKLFNSEPLKILKDCGEEGRKTCFNFCKTMAALTQKQPEAPRTFCIKTGNLNSTYVSVFSKACDGEYEYTGLTFDIPICCKDKEPVPC